MFVLRDDVDDIDKLTFSHRKIIDGWNCHLVADAIYLYDHVIFKTKSNYTVQIKIHINNYIV